MKILVIGGNGYIGGPLSSYLALTHEVDVWDIRMHKESPEALTNVNKDRYQSRQDITKDFFMDTGYDVIYYLAAIAGIQKCEEVGKIEAERVNVTGLRRVLKAAEGKNTRIVFTSTSAIEAVASIYTTQKLAAEYYLGEHKNSIAIRLPTIYGLSTCMRPGVLINDMVREAVETGKLYLWNEEAVRPVMSLNDCVRKLSELIYDDQHPKLITGWGTPISKRHIADTIHYYTGAKLKIEKRDKRFEQFFNEDPRDKYFPLQLEEIIRYYEARI